MRICELPICILEGLPSEPVLSVDGAWGAPGLNLSHWPGQKTPPELRHDLSTGIALAFARLPQEHQAELARGCTALANNHYDTDGVLALFALARPAEALAHADFLLDAAAAGDLFRVPSERAFALDALITGLAEPGSPWEELWRGTRGREKHERLVRELVERLPWILAGGLEELEAVWKPRLERLRADLAELRTATKDEIVHLELAVWTSERRIEPGRHALFGTSVLDRALLLEREGALTRARLIVNTSSWFELVSRGALPRPDLAALAAQLNAQEGVARGAAQAWRAQTPDNPAPELWFGIAELESFAEHNDAQRASRLEPALIRRAVLESLRAAWVFPEDD
ncbi:MAG: hypothetical protein IPJ19_01155 [Planctomycetes bacterium]|nr:hypothetical protein [Planctomycetota bacterium]